MKLHATLVVLCLGLLATSGPASANVLDSDRPHAPGRVLVKLDAAAFPAVTASLAKSVSSAEMGVPSLDLLSREVRAKSARLLHGQMARTDLDRSGASRWVVIELDEGTDLAAVARRFAADPNVENVTLDWQVFPHAVPNDPMYADNWGHDNRGQFKSYCVGCGEHDGGDPVGTVGFDGGGLDAWDEGPGYGLAGVVIAILDTGVDVDHPDLRLVPGFDVAENDPDPDDDSGDAGHGTAVAGVAAAIADNGIGAVGVAGGCSVMPVKLANDFGSIFLSVVGLGIVYAADNGADIINMSFGAPIASDPAVDDALEYAHAAGVVMVASSGNQSMAPIDYPANHPHVIAVGAASPCADRKRGFGDSLGTTCDGEGWWGSNFGDDIQDGPGAIDVLGPSMLPTTDVLGTEGLRTGDYHPWFNGTSSASPYVAGVCALILSGRPTLTPEQVRERLVQSATDVVSVESTIGWDRFSGYGMVDAALAVAGGDHASLPYFTGFEGGALDLHWLAVASPAAKTEVGAFVKPAVGTNALHVQTLGGSANAEAWLFLDLSGETQVTMDFLCRGTGSADPTDGLYFSDDDGFSFTKVWDFPVDLESSWHPVRLDVDQLAAAHGVAMDDDFVVKFRQSSTASAQSVTLDDVLVTGSPGHNLVDLISPTGGERLSAGDRIDLDWRVAPEVHHVDIHYSADGGETWQLVEREYPADEPYQWTVPVLGSAHGRLRIASSARPSLLDVTADEFRVLSPVTAVFSTLPYFTGFETGLDDHWSVHEYGFATVEIDSDNGPSSGTKQLALGTTMDGPTARAEAWLHLDLADQDQVALRFSWQEFGDQFDAEDGVFFSDNGGLSFVKVFDLDGSMVPDNTWQYLTLDLDDLAVSSGLDLTGTFVVKLQQSGRAPIPSNGHAYDDLSVMADGVSAHAPLPYSTGFEAGTLDPFWTINSEPGGRTQVTSDHGPYSGLFHLTMDTEESSYRTNEAWLQLDLFGQTSAILRFQWKDMSDESHVQDGVYISDDGGATFAKVLDLFGTQHDNDVWQSFSLDLAALAVIHGKSLTNAFVVKFQQVDNSALPLDGHAYDDVSVTTDGGVGISTPVLGALPTLFRVHPNVPNPFNPRTTIRFDLPRSSPVQVSVFDLRGRLVKTLLDEVRSAGTVVVPWDGTDGRGTGVASGSYLYRIEAGEFRATRTMTLSK